MKNTNEHPYQYRTGERILITSRSLSHACFPNSGELNPQLLTDDDIDSIMYALPATPEGEVIAKTLIADTKPSSSGCCVMHNGKLCISFRDGHGHSYQPVDDFLAATDDTESLKLIIARLCNQLTNRAMRVLG